MHAANSVKTASKKNGRYEGSPGVETFSVGQKKGTVSMDGLAQATADEWEGKTREELLEMICKASISSQSKGSQPKGDKAGVGSGDFDDDSSLSGSSSSGSSSSADSTSSSSAEVQSPALPSAQGE